MAPTEILTILFWVAILAYMVVIKKDFNFSESSLSGKVRIFLVTVTMIVLVVNSYVFGVAYFKAYNPDFEYDKVSKKVNYYIYRPSILPESVEQVSKYYLLDKEFAGSTNAVRTAYDISVSSMIRGKKSSLTVITQTEVNDSFDIKNYILSAYAGMNYPIIQPISLLNFSNRQAYLQTGGLAKTVYVLTTNNVLVSIASVRETEDNLIKIADSLR